MRNRNEIEEIRNAAGITGASFATANSQGETPYPVGYISDKNSQLAVKKDTLFQCASLSKPVFAYLVLKLIEANENDTAKKGLGKFKMDFNLQTPLYKIFRDKDNGNILEGNDNPFLKKFSDQVEVDKKMSAREEAKKITAEMVLSHTTGLPIMGKPPYSLQFPPGTRYAYSGPGIECLQQVIDELTGTNLEALSQEYVFRKHMPKSTYGSEVSEMSAANSLQTTAEEYARFIVAWINDDKLNDMNNAFKSIEAADSMIKDYLPEKDAVGRLVEKIDTTEPDRKLVAWGLGVGLVKNNDGQVIGVYHTGDMGNAVASWRAGFGATIDPETKHCIEASVYLTKSPNGHMLAEKVLPDELKPALNYFFPTYGFARNEKELDGTNFHGLNPNILNEDLRNLAIATKENQTSLHIKPSGFSTKLTRDPNKK